MRTQTQRVTLQWYTIPPLRISTFQPLEPFNPVETRREAEGPDVGMADGPLSSFQVDAKHHAPHSQTIRHAKVGWVQALCQLLSQDFRELARLHETRPQCTPTSSKDKRYSNMNMCFSCGFDVENGHTSLTCPQAWQHANHQEAYNRSNAQQYIDAGYDACTKAKHKTQLPTF